MRFGIGISPTSASAVSRMAEEAEYLGYRMIGIWDSPSLYCEPWVVLPLVAAATKSAQIGTWVTNPVTRHPAVTAAAAATLAEIAPGRVVLGLGAGDSGVSNLGARPASLGQLERAVVAIRDLLRHGCATVEGSVVSIRKSPQPVPVYLAAHGVRTLELAARTADGVIVGLGCSPDVVSACLGVLATAATACRRSLDELDIWWGGARYDIDVEPGAARRRARRYALTNAHHLGRGTAEGSLVPPRLHQSLRQLCAEYDIATHGRPTEAQQARYESRAEELGLADYLFDRFVLGGTPAEVSEKLSAAAQAGAHQFMGSTAGEDGEDRMRAWGRTVVTRS